MWDILTFGAVSRVREGRESVEREVETREMDFLTRSRMVRTSPVPVATFFAARSKATLSIKGNDFGIVEVEEEGETAERA